jgi:hypothetical protein
MTSHAEWSHSLEAFAMLSRETLERYRQMTLGERLKLTLQMIDEAVPQLLQGDPEVVDRRFELLRRQNDERNRRMLEAIARTRDP